MEVTTIVSNSAILSCSSRLAGSLSFSGNSVVNQSSPCVVNIGGSGGWYLSSGSTVIWTSARAVLRLQLPIGAGSSGTYFVQGFGRVELAGASVVGGVKIASPAVLGVLGGHNCTVAAESTFAGVGPGAPRFVPIAVSCLRWRRCGLHS